MEVVGEGGVFDVGGADLLGPCCGSFFLLLGEGGGFAFDVDCEGLSFVWLGY